MLTIVTAAENLPVTVALARQHVRGPENGDDDVLIERALRSAVEFVEEKTGLSLAPATFEYRVCDWPPRRSSYRLSHEIELPRKPVRDIVSVEYLDADNNLQTVSGSYWNWRNTADGAIIRFGNSYSFPILYAEDEEPVRITFEAGFDDPQTSGSGDDPNLNLPQRAVEAVLLKTELLYDRGSLSDVQSANIETALTSLLGQLKVYR